MSFSAVFIFNQRPEIMQALTGQSSNSAWTAEGARGTGQTCAGSSLPPNQA